jgi:Putative peptidoglycan binding domain
VDRGPDADDWFDDPDVEERRAPEGAPDDTVARADDWLDEEAAGGQLRPSWTQTIDRRIVTVVVSLVALLIAGLAAAGVFSSGSPNAPIGTPLTTAATQATTAATTTAQQVPAPSTTLKPGDKGTQVKVLQRALAGLGFSSGKADGQYGPATTSAVKRFQQSVKLTADGILGPATLRALGNALHGA